jgi:hypothetical protein
MLEPHNEIPSRSIGAVVTGYLVALNTKDTR